MNQSAVTLTAISTGFYLLAAIFYGSLWVKSSRLSRLLSIVFLSIGLLNNFFQLFSRWVEAGQPPFKTLFESLILLAACIAVVYLVIELFFKARVLGLPAALGCVLVMGYALIREDKEVVSLPPALQSGWFVPHVVVYFFGYASLFIASAASLLYLFRPKPIRMARPDLIADDVIDLESLLDGAVRFGLSLLTVGLLVGAAWAKDAWGDYWVWDPKETWSLVSWLLFVAYLHFSYLGGWRGRRLAILVLVGFAAIAFTYLGMGLLPGADQSAHVYQ